MPTKTDYNTMRLQEMAAISELLDTLADEQWDHASLCDDWRVRDVISHMCLGYTTTFPVMLAKIARRGFNVPKASKEESIAYGSSHTPDQLRQTFATIHGQNIRKGITRVISDKEGFVDHFIHHQDIRRPLGLPRPMPADRLLAALDAAPGLGGFVRAKQRSGGLRFVATDIDWSHGDGAEVRGTGEAILLAVSGRPVTLAELEGEGLDALRQRVAA